MAPAGMMASSGDFRFLFTALLAVFLATIRTKTGDAEDITDRDILPNKQKPRHDRGLHNDVQ